MLTLAAGVLLSPLGVPSANALHFACTGYNTDPSVDDDLGYNRIFGKAEQFCSGAYVDQRVDIQLQRKRVLSDTRWSAPKKAKAAAKRSSCAATT